MTAPVRTLAVWCPDWPVVATGAPLAEPVAVVRSNRVVACSPGARRRGVTPGLRRREAQGRCPDLVVVDADPDRDARSFEAVLAAVEAFAPRLEVECPGACTLPTRGPSRYFGGDQALAQQVLAAVHDVLAGRCSPQAGAPATVRVGVADGAFAAHLAARSSATDRASGPVTGPLVDPLVVPPGGSPNFLAPWPLDTLDRPELVGVLTRLGITTLGALAALPVGSLLERFGREGEAAHRLASGLDTHPPHLRTPSPDLEVAVELDPPADQVDQVAFAAKTLADELHCRLAPRGLACTRVVIRAESDHGDSHERAWRHEGILSAAALAERARWQIDGWLNGPVRARPTAGIGRLVLVPTEVVAATGRQLDFWGGESDATERALRVLARLETLVGPEGVLAADPQGGREPGDQVALVPASTLDLAARAGSAASVGTGLTEGAPWPGRVPAPAPARLHDPPLPVAVNANWDQANWDQANWDQANRDQANRDQTQRDDAVSVDGRGQVSAPPARVCIGTGPWAEVVAWGGPWLLDEWWWDGARRRRRARFQVVTDQGQAYLLVLEGGSWWCTATYD